MHCNIICDILRKVTESRRCIFHSSFEMFSTCTCHSSCSINDKGSLPSAGPIPIYIEIPMYRDYKIIWDRHDGISVLVRQYLYIETVPCCRACGSHTKGRHGWFHSSQLGKSTKSRMSFRTLPRHSIYLENLNIKAPFARFILMVFSLYFVLPGQLGDITWCTISMST